MRPLQVREHVPLAPLTTLGIGGPARFLIEAETEDQVGAALDFSRAHACPVFVLGGGSNVLFSDSGFPGLVLRIGISGIRGLEDPAGGIIRVGAGENWDAFVKAAVEHQFAGIECLSGIPGSTGGTPVQNVGAYGQDVSEVVSSIRVLDRKCLTTVELRGGECGFAYRSSIFNTSHTGQYIILSVDFALRKNGAPRIEYPELRRQFEGRRESISLGDVRDAVLRTRAAKAMVLVPGDRDSRSAGSFFRNPVVDRQEFDRVIQAARGRGVLAAGETPPSYPAPDGCLKLPAAWLIERAGFARGYGQGRVGVSSRHTLALINRGGASAGELLALAKEIQDGVRAAFGVDLAPEPVFVGF